MKRLQVYCLSPERSSAQAVSLDRQSGRPYDVGHGYRDGRSPVVTDDGVRRFAIATEASVSRSPLDALGAGINLGIKLGPTGGDSTALPPNIPGGSRVASTR